MDAVGPTPSTPEPQRETAPRAPFPAALSPAVPTAARRPGRSRRGPATARTPRPMLDPGDAERLAQAMPERYRAAVVLAASTGLRTSELFALARAHVDLSQALVLVERSILATPDRRPMLALPKRASERRTVHLPRPALETLTEHLRRHTGRQPESLLFATVRGAALHAAHVAWLMAQAREATGLDVRWHDLRHAANGRSS